MECADQEIRRGDTLTVTAIGDAQASGYARAVGRVQQIMNPVPATPAPPPVTSATGGFADRLSSAMTPVVRSTTGDLGSPFGVPAATQAATFGVGAPAPVAGTAGVPAGGPVGQTIAALATAELGVAEQPPGSNDGPRIAQYRTATAGSAVGPWCAYFTSWVAAQAGVPIGANGAGEGWVPSVRDWAVSQGRYIPSGAGAPAVGDLVVFDRGGTGVLDHIGIVTGVTPDGAIQTVEGNSSDAVLARSYGPGEYAGLVRLG